MRCSPLPFLKQSRVVLACARTCPPMGFLGSAWAMVLPGSAITWFVKQTATLNCSASFIIFDNIRPRTCWRSDSSPRPVKSLRKTAIMESTISRACGDSIIRAAAQVSSCPTCSTVQPLAYLMFSRVYSPSRPYLSAILKMRSGRKVPSVSMQMTLPLPPPFSLGSWLVTQRVCASWVLPVLNSPKASVMAMDSMPPPMRVSRTEEPVVILTTLFRLMLYSTPVMNPALSNFLAASWIFSILASFIPFMLQSSFLVAIITLIAVQNPAAFSLAMSAALIPSYCSLSTQLNSASSTSSSAQSCLDFSLSFSCCFCFAIILLAQSDQTQDSHFANSVIVFQPIHLDSISSSLLYQEISSYSG